MMGWYGFDWGWMVLMMVLMLAFWVGVIFLIAWAVRHWSRRPGMYGGGSRAIDIASERYAKGEISKEEYDRIKKDLS